MFKKSSLSINYSSLWVESQVGDSILDVRSNESQGKRWVTSGCYGYLRRAFRVLGKENKLVPGAAAFSSVKKKAAGARYFLNQCVSPAP